MQRPPIMRALTMPSGDFPYGNTIGLDSPFTSFFFPFSFSLSSSIVSSFFVYSLHKRRKKFRAPFSLPFR